jgi:hypothetical protein
MFGTGKLEELQQLVRKNKKISAVFISTKILTTDQKRLALNLKKSKSYYFDPIVEIWRKSSGCPFTTDTRL